MPRGIIPAQAKLLNKSTGQLLMELFEKHGNQELVAQELGVSQQTVSASIKDAKLKRKIILVPDEN